MAFVQPSIYSLSDFYPSESRCGAHTTNKPEKKSRPFFILRWILIKHMKQKKKKEFLILTGYVFFNRSTDPLKYKLEQMFLGINYAEYKQSYKIWAKYTQN